MTSTMLNRRTLLMGLAASAGTAILAACGGTDATTAPTAAAAGATATRPATGGATTAAMAATGGATTAATGGATTAATAATGGATTAATAATGGATTAATAATGGATTAATTAPSAAATARPATTGSATAGTTGTVAGSTTTTGTTAASAPAMMSAATGGMPMGPSMCATGNIVVLGSTALQPVVEAAQKAYAAKCNGAQINVQGGGSGTGLTQVFGGQAAIGDSDIFGEEANGIDAKQLEDHQVCIEPFAIAANPSVNITNLTQDQVISIWTGKVTNFKDVGGPDQAIVIINRPASSGTRATFKRYALNGMNEKQGTALTEDSSGAVAAAIKGTPGAIGYLALAYFLQNKDLKTVNFNGKTPTIENISDNSYPIWAYGHMYTKGPAMGLAKAFIDYILSNDVQNTIVPNNGYFSVGQVKAKHTAT